MVPAERTLKEGGVQTMSISSRESMTQTKEMNSVMIQTDPCKIKQLREVDVDYDSLNSFLQRVTPLVCNYLEKNSRSHAFDNYKLLKDEEMSLTNILYTLTHKIPSEFQCLDVSWNSTGTVLAIAYGAPTHSDWCSHESVIAIWNIQRKDFNHNKPNLTIETDSCMTAIEFHPEKPALLAAGKFNGEIIIWDIGKDDDMHLTDLPAHREIVTGIHWIQNKEQTEYLLVSCSLDGQILIWRLDDNQKLKNVERFILLVDEFPRSHKIRSKRPNAEVGITSLSFNSEDNSIFIIGTEGGGIFQCSLNSEVIANYTSADFIYKSPVVMSFDGHLGCTESVHCSPHSRNAFLSCGSDGEIHIYSLLQSKPILVLKTHTGFKKVEWSPVRPLIISALTYDGQLFIYDIGSDTSVPLNTYNISEGKTGCTLHFNKQNSQLLTTATTDQNIQVWKLGSDILFATDEEHLILAKLTTAASLD